MGYDQLHEVLDQSRELGFLGPCAVDTHYRHAQGFVSLIAPRCGEPVLDLGSGGGLPGLVLAVELAEARLTLVDAQERRCAFLRSAIRQLGVDDRVDVVVGRAEALARRPEHRARYGTVVARSFGRPAVTAECAVGFLAADGVLYTSEPVSDPDRWPADGLEGLGLILGHRHTFADSAIQAMRRSERDIDEFPRSDGVPARRPMF